MKERHARRQRQKEKVRAAAAHRAAENGDMGSIMIKEHAKRTRSKKKNRTTMKKVARMDAAGNGRVPSAAEKSEDEDESTEEDERDVGGVVPPSRNSIAMAMTMTMATLTVHDIQRDMQSPHPPVVHTKEQWPPWDFSIPPAPTNPRPRVRLPCEPGEAASLQASAILRAALPSRPANPFRDSVSTLQSLGDQSRTAQPSQEYGENKHSEALKLPGLPEGSIINGPLQLTAKPRPAFKRRRRPTAEDFWSSDEDDRELRAKRLATADSVDAAYSTLPLIPKRSLAASQNDMYPDLSKIATQPGEYTYKRLDHTDNARHSEQKENRDPTPNLSTLKRAREDSCSEPEPEHKEPKRQKIRRKRRKRKVPRTSPDADQPETTTQSSTVLPKSRKPDRIEPQISVPRLDSLPGNVQDIIIGILLKSEEPLRMKTNWLEPKFPPGARFPSTTMTLIKGSSRMTTPTTTKYYLKSRHTFQAQLERFRATLQQAPHHGQQPRAPSKRRSTLSLLYVSKAIHERAAKILYSENIFEIDSADAAWLHLEVFLATIGSKNAGHLQHLRVSGPKWSPNSSKDAVAGVLLDHLKPSVDSVQDPGQNRLFSAIANCTDALARGGGLKSLEISISCTEVRTFLGFHSENWHCILSDAEQAEHAKRKDEGVVLFRAMSESLGPDCKPLLVVYTGEKISWLLKSAGERQFADRFEELVDEAERYGWDVEEEMRQAE